jgi:uncharacterized protein (DUF4415 family)
MSENNADTKTAWVNPDDAPELEDDFFERADLYKEGVLVQRGRPLGSTKVSTTIRFDSDVLEAFKEGGRGWQTRMNHALRQWLDEHRASGKAA